MLAISLITAVLPFRCLCHIVGPRPTDGVRAGGQDSRTTPNRHRTTAEHRPNSGGLARARATLSRWAKGWCLYLNPTCQCCKLLQTDPFDRIGSMTVASGFKLVHPTCRVTYHTTPAAKGGSLLLLQLPVAESEICSARNRRLSRSAGECRCVNTGRARFMGASDRSLSVAEKSFRGALERDGVSAYCGV